MRWDGRVQAGQSGRRRIELLEGDITEQDVDDAVETVEELISGPVVLRNEKHELEFVMQQQDMAAAVRAEIIAESPARIDVFIDEDVVDSFLEPKRPELETEPTQVETQTNIATDGVTVIPGEAGTAVEAADVTPALYRAALAEWLRSGAGREARRAALSHFLINLFGVLLALPILHILLDGIAWFLAPMGDGAVDIAIHLALLHTAFNGVVTGVFGLFPRPILWLVRKLVPGEGIRGFKSPLVTASVMDAPELQVLEAQREAERHHELASGMVVEMKALLEELNPTRRKAIADRLMEAHNLGARYEGEIKGFLERLARSKLSGATYRQVQFLLEWTTEMGQVVELAQRFRQLQSERERDEIFFVPKQRKRLNEMMDLLKEAMGTLGELNTPIAPPYGEAEVHMGQVESTLIELDGVRQQMRKSRKEDIRKGRYTPESAMAYKEMGDLLEEMGLRMGLVVSRYAEIFKA